MSAAAVVILLIARAPDAFFNPQFYAEDANMFWSDWRNLGMQSLWHPLAGYLHLVPRTIAGAVWPLPYEFHPLGFVILAALGYAWTTGTIATVRLPRGLAVAFAVATMLVPHDGEIWASAVNLQWVMACALPLIASTSPPDTRVLRVNQLMFLLVAGLTGPFSTFAIPLWAVRGIWSTGQRCSHGMAVASIGLATGLIQLAVIATNPIAMYPPTGPKPMEMVLTMLQRWGWEHLDQAGTAVGATLFALLLASPIIREGRWQRLAFLAFAAAILAGAFIKLYQSPEVIFAGGGGGRYFYVPSVMLLWTALSLVWTGRVLVLAAGALASISIVVSAMPSFTRNPHSDFPDWREKAHLIGTMPLDLNHPPGGPWILHVEPDPPEARADQ